jgi:tetratricopeptide (TPR) repeat protein
MESSRPLFWYCCLFFIATSGLATLAGDRYSDPFPPLTVSLASPAAYLSDFAGMAMGFRRLTADLAWIQTLIYYGTDEETEEGRHTPEMEEGIRGYPLFLAYCQRVAGIDPYFKYIFYYGGAVLGWNLNRLDEAEELLKEGIRLHPKEWRLQQFLAGLAFQKNHDINHLISFLEVFIEEPDCPNILRSILANIYKKQNRYRDAIRVWIKVYNTGDPNYLQRAVSQIKEMAPLAHQKRKIGLNTH